LSRACRTCDTFIYRRTLSGQIDADRADYLLRDSYHTGVSYGHYDIDRLLVTIGIGIDEADGGGIIVIDKGGMHVAEGLIIARYMMFSQVYFHRTRRIYDYHIGKVMNELLKESQNGDDRFPPPTSKEYIQNYLQWTDWKVLGEIEKNRGGEHAKIISERKHFRCVHETSESPTDEEVLKIDNIYNALGKMVRYADNSCKTTIYKLANDIQIQHTDNNERCLKPLSMESLVVKNLKPTGQIRIYVSIEDQEEAKRIIAKA
ncbi:MAG: HD domain-containing protein, partial [bacterium]